MYPDPGIAVSGTSARNVVDEMATTLSEGNPAKDSPPPGRSWTPKYTAENRVKFFPVIVTELKAAADLGETESIEIGGSETDARAEDGTARDTGMPTAIIASSSDPDIAPSRRTSHDRCRSVTRTV